MDHSPWRLEVRHTFSAPTHYLVESRPIRILRDHEGHRDLTKSFIGGADNRLRRIHAGVLTEIRSTSAG